MTRIGEERTSVAVLIGGAYQNHESRANLLRLERGIQRAQFIDPAMRAENISVAQYCLMANWLSDNLPTKES